jgi:uncharacterized paraquat-inducible protein A
MRNKIMDFLAAIIPGIMTLLLVVLIFFTMSVRNENQKMVSLLSELREWISTSTYNVEYVNKIDSILKNSSTKECK